MHSFITEYFTLCEDIETINGIYSVRVRCVVMDSPARAFFLNVKSYSGYYSCHKCKIAGEYITNKVCFPGIARDPRSDEEFKAKSDNNHHLNSNTLLFEDIPNFGCVTNVVIDYMHVVLLGVTKRLLQLWTKVKRCTYSLRNTEIKKISTRIMQIGPQLPREFARKPRDLDYLARFKATEFRQLVVYTLPVILKGILKTKYYNHFMQLHCAIQILCSSEKCLILNRVANDLLINFVKQYSKLYLKYQVTFNVHSLLHLADDVKFLQKPLDSFSAFKFENYLQILKKEPKNCVRVLEQIANRNVERSHIQRILPSVFTNKSSVRTKENQSNFKYIDIYDVRYSINEPNNFVYISSKNVIFKISKIINVTQQTVVFEGHEVLKLKPFYRKPFPSDLLGIYSVSGNMTLGAMKIIEIDKKCLKKVAKFHLENINHFFTLNH